MSIPSKEEMRDGCLGQAGATGKDKHPQAKLSAPTEEHEDHSMSRGTTAAMALG